VICWAECIRKEARSASSKHAEVQLRDLVSSACENLSLVVQSKSQRKLQLSWRLTHVQCKVSERGSTSASAEAQVEAASGLKRKASDSTSRSLLTEWRLCSSIHLLGKRNKKPGLSALSCIKEAFIAVLQSRAHRSRSQRSTSLRKRSIASLYRWLASVSALCACSIRRLLLVSVRLSRGVPLLSPGALLFLRSTQALSLSLAFITLPPSISPPSFSQVNGKMCVPRTKTVSLAIRTKRLMRLNPQIKVADIADGKQRDTPRR